MQTFWARRNIINVFIMGSMDTCIFYMGSTEADVFI